MNFWLKRLGLGLLILILTAVSIVACHFSIRPGLDEYQQALILPNAAAKDEITDNAVYVRWFGVTAIVIEDNANTIVIDPFFSRPTGWLPLITNQPISPNKQAIIDGLAKADIAKADAVLVSHSHFDHAMDAPTVATLTGATLYGSDSTINLGKGENVAATQLQPIVVEQSYTIGQFKITFLESEHAGATGGRPTGNIDEPLEQPARYLDYKLGGTYSILIEHPLGNILHHGSAGFKPNMFANVPDVDLVLLGITIRPDLDTYYANTVDKLNTTRVIPTHWDDFTIALPDDWNDLPKPMPFGVQLDDFFANSKKVRPDLEVITLKLNQAYKAF